MGFVNHQGRHAKFGKPLLNVSGACFSLVGLVGRVVGESTHAIKRGVFVQIAAEARL